MSDIFAILARIDPLAALFIVGSLALLWGAWTVITDDSEFEFDFDADSSHDPAPPADRPQDRHRPAA